MKKPIKSTFPHRGQKVEKAEFIFGSAEVTGPIPVSSSEEQDCEKGGNYCIIEAVKNLVSTGKKSLLI